MMPSVSTDSHGMAGLKKTDGICCPDEGSGWPQSAQKSDEGEEIEVPHFWQTGIGPLLENRAVMKNVAHSDA
jgi:hypothetical protein